MRILRLYADAALGGLLPNPVLPTRNIPAQTGVEQTRRPAQGDDAALVRLSSAAREFAASDSARMTALNEAAGRASGGEPTSRVGATEAKETGRAEKTSAQELSEEEERQVAELKARDREVRAHEQAHLGALGAYSKGGAQYQYTTGPDGKQYAVGGEVAVDVSPAQTPEQTLRKAETIRRAANAPAEPSSADRAVAAQAAQLAAEARSELQRQRTEELSGSEAARTEVGQGVVSAGSSEDAGAERSVSSIPVSRAAVQAHLSYAQSSERGSQISVSA